jgi:hypothetical protein
MQQLEATIWSLEMLDPSELRFRIFRTHTETVIVPDEPPGPWPDAGQR